MFAHILSTVTAALLARALAIHFHLAMPQVAMACVFIIMQPQLEQVLSKSMYRMVGSIVGVLATLLLAGRYAATPAGFLLAVGCWVSFCTASARMGRQPRAYAVVLSGYTAVIVGVRIAFEPDQAGLEGLMRLQEVGLGIGCAVMLAMLRQAFSAAASSYAALWSISLATPATTAATATATPAMPLIPGVPGLQAPLAAALHPAAALFLVGGFWLAGGWAGGAIATLNTTVNAALVSLAPSPRAAAEQIARGTLLSVAVSLLVQGAYHLLDAETALYLVLAPALALAAYINARPERLAMGLGYGISLCMLGYPHSSLPGQASYLDDAGGILLSVPALLLVCATIHRLTGRRTWQTRYNPPLP